MKIWWCQKHEKKRSAFDDNCWFDHRATNCVIVPMRLVPDNGETTIDRECLVAALAEFEVQWSQSLGAHTISQHTQFALRDAARTLLALDGETP